VETFIVELTKEFSQIVGISVGREKGLFPHATIIACLLMSFA
jgi:hypothetical protein